MKTSNSRTNRWGLVVAAIVLPWVTSCASLGAKPAPIEARQPQPSIALWGRTW